MDLPQTIVAYSHSHGEEQRKLIHKTDSKTQASNGSMHQKQNQWLSIIITAKLEILVTKESLRRFNNLLQTIRVSSHNHGEEQRLLIHKMDSRTQLGTGSMHQNQNQWLNINTTIIIIPKILVIMALTRKSMDSPQMTPTFSHNHGEEQRKLIHKTDSRTQASNGSMHQNQWLNITIIITAKLKILVTKESLRKSNNSHQTIRVSSHSHGEEQRLLIQKTDSKTQLGTIFHNKKREILEIMV